MLQYSHDMKKVNKLIWDEWNKNHIKKHNLTTDEIEEVCRSKNKIYKTYRGRIEIIGRTNLGKKLKIILSPEDRNLELYGKGIYYPITAYAEGEKNEQKK